MSDRPVERYAPVPTSEVHQDLLVEGKGPEQVTDLRSIAPAESESESKPTPERRSTAAPRHIPSLDGLRALAIFAVFGLHAGVPGMALGWLGVDLFFVLSGFLITSLLVQEYQRTGTIRLANFWGRRFLRLMPTYWLYASFITFAIYGARWGWTQSYNSWTPGAYVASIWFYFTNYVPKGGIWEYQILTVHLWSLSVEEQFYLFWPIVCVLFLRRGQFERLAWTIVLALAVCLLTGIPGSRIYASNFGILLGCAVSAKLAFDPGADRYFVRPLIRVLIILSCIIPILIGTLLFQKQIVTDLDLHHYGPLIFCPAFATLVAMLWYGPQTDLARWLSWKPLVYLGKISYGLYLYHMLAHFLTWEVILSGIDHWNKWLKFGVRFTVFCTLSIGFASFSFAFIEKKFLVLKARLR